MRGDLNDQFQRAQGVSADDNTSQKIIIAVAITLAVCFILIVIVGVIFITKTMDKFVDAEGTESYNTEVVTDDTGAIVATPTTEFQYGVIDGTTYYSSFSGIRFAAPSDWMFTSYETARPSKSPKDMSASGNNMSCSVVLQYESIQSNRYNSVTDALDSTQKMIDSYGYKVLDSNASAKWGGNMFTGMIFVDTFNNYKEVLVAEVNGYVLKISLTASSDTNLSIIRSYFS